MTACKYTLKYTNKGAVFNLSNEPQDEISEYQNTKYLGSNEAATHILGLKTGGLQPPVKRLNLHLPNEQNIIYSTGSNQPSAISSCTKLTSFFEICYINMLRHLSITRYQNISLLMPHQNLGLDGKGEVPKYISVTVVLLFMLKRCTSPKLEELYYLCLLLVTIPGPTSFANLKTVYDVVCSTFKIACQTQISG